jgi:hypothetical protein
MNETLRRRALLFLHWSVGLVVLWQSWLTFHSTLEHWHAAGHSAALAYARLVLSGAEMVAAILFLVPFTVVMGGYFLLVIFALAIVIHLLHGDPAGLETLVVYGAAVLVSVAHRKQAPTSVVAGHP